MLSGVVDPHAERSRREPLVESELCPDRVEGVAGHTCGDPQVFDERTLRLLDQRARGLRPDAVQNPRGGVRVAVDRRFAEIASDGVELIARDRAGSERVGQRCEPGHDRRPRRDERRRQVGTRPRRAFDVGASTPGHLLDHRRAVAVPSALRESVVARPVVGASLHLGGQRRFHQVERGTRV